MDQVHLLLLYCGSWLSNLGFAGFAFDIFCHPCKFAGSARAYNPESVAHDDAKTCVKASSFLGVLFSGIQGSSVTNFTSANKLAKRCDITTLAVWLYFRFSPDPFCPKSLNKLLSSGLQTLISLKLKPKTQSPKVSWEKLSLWNNRLLFPSNI